MFEVLFGFGLDSHIFLSEDIDPVLFLLLSSGYWLTKIKSSVTNLKVL